MRGSSGGGRGTGIAVGGGGIGLVLVIIYVLLGGNPGDLGGAGGPAAGGGGGGPAASTLDDCKTGVDANAKEDCRILGYVNSVQAFWQKSFQDSGRQYQPATTRFFTGSRTRVAAWRPPTSARSTARTTSTSTSTSASSTTCATSSARTGGPFAEAYVLAHEYGHHVQDLARHAQGGARLAGRHGDVGAHRAPGRLLRRHVGQARRSHGLPRASLTEAEIADALDAASAVGDDRIQQRDPGPGDPETWTHGSAAQRRTWFTNGFQGGTEKGCDTFNAQL